MAERDGDRFFGGEHGSWGSAFAAGMGAAAGTSVVYGVGAIFLMRGSDRAMRITEMVAFTHSVLLPVVLFLAAIVGIETTGGQGIRPAVVSGLLCGPLIGLNLALGFLAARQAAGEIG